MKLTSAQAALLHTLESAASSAILTFIVGLIQYLGTHQVSWQELTTIFASGFVACFGLIYKSVKTDPNLPQAESDTAVEAQSLAQKAIRHIEAMWPILNAHSNALNSAQKPATPVSTPTNLFMPQNVTAAANPLPIAATSTPVGASYIPQVPFAATLPPRSWTDTALTQAITPQPPKG